MGENKRSWESLHGRLAQTPAVPLLMLFSCPSGAREQKVSHDPLHCYGAFWVLWLLLLRMDDSFQYLKGAYKHDGNLLFTRVDNGRTRGNGFKLKEGRFKLDSSSLLWEWWGAGTGCPETMLHPWRCSRPGWMGSCAVWSSVKCGDWQPCLWYGSCNLIISEVSSNTSHSIILWFLA